jgi:hypothetical protein
MRYPVAPLACLLLLAHASPSFAQTAVPDFEPPTSELLVLPPSALPPISPPDPGGPAHARRSSSTA